MGVQVSSFLWKAVFGMDVYYLVLIPVMNSWLLLHTPPLITEKASQNLKTQLQRPRASHWGVGAKEDP